jgi:hypothetical protein
MISLIHKGAKHALGWDGTIYSKDNDKALIMLLDGILVNKVPLYDAVEEINQDVIHDFKLPTILKIFNAA